MPYYYDELSCINVVEKIKIPVLCINSLDDMFFNHDKGYYVEMNPNISVILHSDQRILLHPLKRLNKSVREFHFVEECMEWSDLIYLRPLYTNTKEPLLCQKLVHR